MSIKYERKQIAQGIYISLVRDDKFKTNYAAVQFISAFRTDEASARSIVPNILTVSNSEYPTREGLNLKLASLYSASLYASETIVGDNYISSIYASCISDAYAIEKENVTEELMKLLISSIFSPKLENGRFDDSEFSQLKQELIDMLDAEINNKRMYAIMQARKHIYEGEACAVSPYGTKSDAEKLTSEEVYQLYLSMLESSHVEIMLCGGDDILAAEKMLTDAFSKLPRKNVNVPTYYQSSPIKTDTVTVSDTMDVKQTRIVMSYKCGEADLYAAKIFTALFGMTPTSKLFVNVREKMHLCYTCSATYDEYRNVLTVECGIDDANLEKATEAINEQLSLIAQGDFTDDELSETKLMLTGAFRSNYDSLFSLMSWYNIQYRRGTSFTPDEVIEKLNNVDREQVIACARSFKPDVVYALRPDKQKEADDQLE